MIVVYDTAAVRNARVLRTCRRYLHHVQRSVFEGNLTPAQLRRFEHRIEDVIDSAHDHVLIYTLPPGADAERRSLGAGWAARATSYDRLRVCSRSAHGAARPADRCNEPPNVIHNAF